MAFTRRNQIAEAVPVLEEVAKLEQLAESCGLEQGLHNMQPDVFADLGRSKLERLSEKHVGSFGPAPGLLLTKTEELEEERQSVETRCQTALAELSQKVWQWPSAVARESIAWRTATATVVLFSALFGLALQSEGLALDWREIAVLSLGAALVLVNLPQALTALRWLAALPGWSRFLLARWRDYRAYRRLRAQVESLDRRIAETRLQREAEIERRQVAEEWVDRTLPMIIGRYAYARAKGETAAKLAMHS